MDTLFTTALILVRRRGGERPAQHLKPLRTVAPHELGGRSSARDQRVSQNKCSGHRRLKASEFWRPGHARCVKMRLYWRGNAIVLATSPRSMTSAGLGFRLAGSKVASVSLPRHLAVIGLAVGVLWAVPLSAAVMAGLVRPDPAMTPSFATAGPSPIPRSPPTADAMRARHFLGKNGNVR